MNGKLSDLGLSAARAGAVSTLLALLVTIAAAPATSAPRVGGAELERALQELVDMPGLPPGVIVLIKRGRHLEVHAAGVAEGRDAPSAAHDRSHAHRERVKGVLGRDRAIARGERASEPGGHDRPASAGPARALASDHAPPTAQSQAEFRTSPRAKNASTPLSSRRPPRHRPVPCSSSSPTNRLGSHPDLSSGTPTPTTSSWG
jgi:hypothetical protein